MSLQTRFTFVTSNDLKVMAAHEVCDKHDILFDRQVIDFVEIQSDNGETIARDKAAQAYTQLNTPLVVTDDSWLIPGLGGFPGPYMKQVNDWFTPDDWIRLTRDLTDRRMILRQIIVYQDSDGQRVFTSDVESVLLTSSRSQSGHKHFSIISFDGGVHSAAEVVESGRSALQNEPNSWHELCAWLQSA